MFVLTEIPEPERLMEWMITIISIAGIKNELTKKNIESSGVIFVV
jgi:hypothetical protein